MPGMDRHHHAGENEQGGRDHGHSGDSEDVSPCSGAQGVEKSLTPEECQVLKAGLDELEGKARQEKCDVMIISQHHLSEAEVAEVFSAPRVSAAAEAVGLKCGPTYDLITGTDLSDEKERARVRQELAVRKPKFLLVCPPCRMYSPLQSLRKDRESETWHHDMKEANEFLEFAMMLCKDQWDRGDVFVFEHPKGAKSWKHEKVEQIEQLSGVFKVVMDQCMFGLRDRVSRKLHRKSTCLLTNSPHVAAEMNKLCDKSHEHEPLFGSVKVNGKWVARTRLAQEYPRKMVNALLTGFLRDREERRTSHAVHCVLAIEQLDTRDEKKIAMLLKRCHENLGHPSTPRFVGMLKSARATEQCIKIAKGLKCATCDQFQAQKSHHVSKPAPLLHFNDLIAVDTFEVELSWRKLKVLNIIDVATHFQVCVPLWKGIEVKRTREAYRRYWKRWAGAPKKVLSDGGPEFGQEWTDGSEQGWLST